MTSRVIPVDPFTLVVFGATGDLARRKLLPALLHRDLAGQIPPLARIIGVARRPLNRSAYQDMARESVAHLQDEANGTIEAFIDRIHYVTTDAESGEGWDGLKRLVDACRTTSSCITSRRHRNSSCRSPRVSASTG